MITLSLVDIAIIASLVGAIVGPLYHAMYKLHGEVQALNNCYSLLVDYINTRR